MKLKQTKIAAYYFGCLSIIAGIAGIISLFQGQANLFFATMPVAAISALLFVALMRMYDKRETEQEQPKDSFAGMRIAKYGNETVLIEGNTYTTLTTNQF